MGLIVTDTGHGVLVVADGRLKAPAFPGWRPARR